MVFDENPEVFISSALSPTKVKKVSIEDGGTRAKVLVPEDQLSIAIGKGGQNVRLASKLTGLEIDIEADKDSETNTDKDTNEEKPQAKEDKKVETVADSAKPKLKRKSDLESSLLSAIDEHGE